MLFLVKQGPRRKKEHWAIEQSRKGLQLLIFINKNKQVLYTSPIYRASAGGYFRENDRMLFPTQFLKTFFAAGNLKCVEKLIDLKVPILEDRFQGNFLFSLQNRDDLRKKIQDILESLAGQAKKEYKKNKKISDRTLMMLVTKLSSIEYN